VSSALQLGERLRPAELGGMCAIAAALALNARAAPQAVPGEATDASTTSPGSRR
jgi:hypothetical protein